MPLYRINLKKIYFAAPKAAIRRTYLKTYLRLFLIVFGLGIAVAMPGTSFAAGGSSDRPAVAPTDPDLDRANQAIKEKNWNRAVDLLNAALARDPKNAEIYNLLGYSERNRGNLDAAFKYYDRALALDPKHRGAHEYIGEAYLMTGNLGKAEEQLAILNKLCFLPCEEYKDLKAAIAAYKLKAAK
jgi:tetratricopeptide (TPR) repeat protein